MFAAEIFAPERIRLVDTAEPASKGEAPPGHVLLRPSLACLCGSDLPYFRLSEPDLHPRIGQSLHEMIGRVEETTGTRFAVGDEVLAVPIDHFGFFERYWVPEERAIPVDARCSPAEAVLAQPLGTVLFALRRLPSVAGRRVAVFGAGPIGQLLARALPLMGAALVVLVDRSAERLAYARDLPGVVSIPGDAAEACEAVVEAAGGEVDLAIEAIGHDGLALDPCIAVCRPHGDILLFGIPAVNAGAVRLKQLFWKNQRLHTSVGPDFAIDFPLAMRMIAERRIQVEALASHRFAVDRVQEAFDCFAAGGEAMKVFLEFPAVAR